MAEIRIRRLGAPILTQTYPAIPPGSPPGKVMGTQTYPAFAAGSSPGTPIEVMERTAAELTREFLQKAKLQKTTSR